MEAPINLTPTITVNAKGLFATISLQVGVIADIQGMKQKSTTQEVLNVSMEFTKEDQFPKFLEDFKALLQKTAEGKK